jgi:hypothetical protein
MLILFIDNFELEVIVKRGIVMIDIFEVNLL